ncbi:MAG TPA: hypothetical protein VK590_06900, partial [Saprospiraceae bacterium]|nr:hypothetical protein [Saprospiraceae bacterium]
MKTYLPLISISILVLFIACSKEDNIHALDLGVNYKSNILGFVTDEDSLPIEGAMVNYNGSVKLTDKHGVYAFTNVDVNSKNSFIKIAKSGYFDSGRSFSTGNSSNIRVSNILSRKLFDLNFDSNSNGGTGTNEFQVLFQENSLLYEQNTSLFKGFFEIAGKYIDPTQV